MIRSSKILSHAKGQNCTLRLPGICNGNPDTVVFCHLNTGAAGKGMGIKAHDSLGFFGCSACHAAYDQQRGRAELALEVLDAVCETHVLLVKAGLIVIDQDPAPKSRGIRQKGLRGSSRPIPQHVNPWPPKGSRKLPTKRALATGEQQ